ncbi:MAG TPA: pitrilysin family protein [Candidatus Lustribacter sp.]|jgi:predicted Zn-dependent peptidase|nr:pitrilysin family protein [Candidatus Lustribacter sp.]
MIRESALPGGLRLLTERMPDVRSATLGIFAQVGSSEEPAGRRGISHLLEHMIFKGTTRRTARRIAEEMDAVGGNLNAATDKELTVYYAHVMDKHLPLAVDVLSDMFLHSLFDAEELRKERDVVLEEIKMYDDSPDEVINDAFARTLWNGANLGDPTIGFAHTVAAIGRDELAAWHRERYSPGTVLIAAAGNLDHDELATRLGEAFATFGGSAVAAEPEQPVFHPAVTVTHDDTAQAYVMLGMPGLSMRDERRYTLSVLDTILGGGMSSRLFQSVREERGLAYEVSSFQQAYRAAGLFGVSAGTSPERVQECVDVIVDQIDGLVEGGVTADEVARAREHLKGNMTLALESTSSRMSRLARNAIVHGRQISAEEVEARFDAVEAADVNALARELFTGERGLCVLGPLAADAVRLRRPNRV